MASRQEQERRKSSYQKTDVLAWARTASQGFESTSVKLPDGFEFFKLKVGTMMIDVIPYIVGIGNPRADKGFLHFERTFHVHRIPGLDGKASRYNCSAATFKDKCAGCDYLNTGPGRNDPEQQKDLKIQMRQLWNVRDLGETPRKVRVFDSAFFKSFGAMMATKVKAVKKYANFAELEGGFSLQLTVDDNPPYGQQITNIEVLPREEDYDEEILQECACLDDCLVHYPYKKMESLLLGIPEGESSDDDEPTPTKKTFVGRDNGHTATKPKAKAEEDDDDEPVKPAKKPATKGKTAKECGIKVGGFVMYEDVEYEVIHISPDGTSLKLESQDNDRISAIDPEDCTLVKLRKAADEDEDPAKPSKKPSRVQEDDDDEPAPKAKKKPAKDDDELIDDDEPVRPAKKPSKVQDDDEPREDDDDEPVKPAKKPGKR